MDRDQVWRVIDGQRASLAEMLDSLTEQEWEAPSLCAGWRVRDVAAHLTLSQMGILSAAVAAVRARGNFNRMVHDTAVRQARRPVHEYARRLRAMAGSRRKAPGVSHLEPLIDVLVHGQDIAIPLERTRAMPTEAAMAAADRVWPDLFPWRAGRKLSGFRFVATDCTWSAGDGALVEGPISVILLLLTGRNAALSQLSGPGTTELGRSSAGSTGTVLRLRHLVSVRETVLGGLCATTHVRSRRKIIRMVPVASALTTRHRYNSVRDRVHLPPVFRGVNAHDDVMDHEYARSAGKMSPQRPV